MKLNFIKEVIISITDFEGYKYFLNSKITKSLSYLFKLVSILTILIAIATGYILIDLKDKVKHDLNNNIQELHYSNSLLSVNSNENLEFKYNKFISTKILINTTEGFEYNPNSENLNNESELEIVVLREKILISSSGQVETIYYKDINIEKNEFTKEDIFEIFESKYIIILTIIIIVLVYIAMAIAYFILMLLDTLILNILGLLTAKTLKMKMSFTQLWSLAIHSSTLSIILNIIYTVVNLLTGFSIKYFVIMYVAISYIYLITSILLLKTDCIIIERQIQKIKSQMNDEIREMQNKEEKTDNENQTNMEEIEKTNNEKIKNENNINNDEKNNTKGE